MYSDTPTASAGARLRELLRQQSCVFMAGCYDAMSARLAEIVGFKAVAISGFGVEAALLGRPDLGLATMTEVVDQAARITNAVQVPVLCDADTGFGGTHNVMRTVREMERAGLAAIHIEDQPLPKRCPVLDGRKVIDLPQAVARIEAACAARRDPDFMIVARCDADAVSYDDLVLRSQAYLAAGADMVLPMMMAYNGRRVAEMTPDEEMELYRRLVADIDGPVMGLMIPKGYSFNDMAEAGYRIVSLAAMTIEASTNAMYAVLAETMRTGSLESYFKANPQTFPVGRAIMDLVHLPELLEIEERFGA
jgi:methylisocitrate lyase